MNNIQTPESLGEKNKKTIIELLKNKGPLSRADISRAIGLSFPAVSSNVNYLLKNNYILETGEGHNSMGRKSTLIEFNLKKGYVVGIDLGRFVIRLKISDLLGNSIVTLSNEIKPEGVVNRLTDQINILVQEAIKECNIHIDDILSVGIGIPGVMEKETGKIILAPYIQGWDDINIQDEIKKIFECPIIIQNSVDLGAVGEKWKGCGVVYNNLVYINYSIGIGSALIINNKLYTGKDGVAGEIGYASIAPSFIRREYNDAGALEQLISGNSIDKSIKESGMGINTLEELFKLNTLEAKEKRDAIVNNIERYFGVMLINIASILNPEAIILSGGIGINVGRLLIPKWDTMLKANLPFSPKLICSEMGSEANVYGAVRYALSNIEDNYCAWK